LLSLGRRPPSSPLFPYTTLFRSHVLESRLAGVVEGDVRRDGRARLDALEAVDAGLVTPLDLLVDRDELPGAHETGGVVVSGLDRSEEHTSELQSRENLVCRLLLE